MDLKEKQEVAKVLLNKNDFEIIKSKAIKLYIDRSWPKSFIDSHKVISESEASVFSLIEATISYLNYKGCLKQIPEFNYKKGELK